MSALWEHAVDDSMLVPWHRANASRSADGWELVAVTSATGARYERYFWKRPAEDAAQGGATFDLGSCEACSNDASVRLADGSTWCRGCDASARNLGYDAGDGEL